MYKSNCVHSPGCDDSQKMLEELISSESDRVKSILEEQLLREYILGIDSEGDMFSTCCMSFGIDEMTDTRMIILKPSGAKDFEEFNFVKLSACKIIGRGNLILITIINDFVLAVTTVLDKAEITSLIDEIRLDIKKSYSYNLMAVYSKVVYLSETPSAYNRLKIDMGYSFYSDSDRTLYENDIKINDARPVIHPEYGAFEHAVSGGDRDKLKMLLSSYFKGIEKAMPVPEIARMYLTELYVSIIRCCSVETVDRYMNGIVYIQKADTAEDIKAFIEETAMEITSAHAPDTNKIYSALIRDTINIIDENVENENLSLRWLAGTILYTNVDYLGKLFKKETGKNFSHYVMEKRMEMAKELILEGKKDRIYEVAEKVGYGSNSQYFSQVFKKYTGVSPLEYKEFARLSREKTKAEKNTKN